MKHIIGLMAMLLPIICGAQSPPVRALSIGDTVPDIVFNHVINYKDTTARLSDFKEKLVILDFWGEYCAPCIKFLFDLESIQNRFRDKIQVLGVSNFNDKKEFFAAQEKIVSLKKLKIPILFKNPFLDNFFPHQLISHLVWIDGNRVVKAITGSEYVTEENIKRILAGEVNNWPVKKDAFEFDYKLPLLSFTQDDIVHPAFAYYSTFTSFIEGIAPPSGTTLDSVRKIAFTAFYNHDILSFCQIALNYKVDDDLSQYILNVKDSNRYERNNYSLGLEWQNANTYCYYAWLPLKLSENEREEFIRKDILRWLQLLGIRVEKVKKSQNGKLTEFYEVTETDLSLLQNKILHK